MGRECKEKGGHGVPLADPAFEREEACENSINMDFSFGIIDQTLNECDHPWVELHGRERGPKEFVVNSIESLFEIEFHEDHILVNGHNMFLAQFECQDIVYDTSILYKVNLLYINNFGDDRLEAFGEQFQDDFVSGGEHREIPPIVEYFQQVVPLRRLCGMYFQERIHNGQIHLDRGVGWQNRLGVQVSLPGDRYHNFPIHIEGKNTRCIVVLHEFS